VELSDYLRILRQRGWLIILLAALTAAAAYGFSRMQTPVYQSTARLLVTSRPDFGQTQAAKALVRDYAVWLQSSLRAAKVINELQLDMTPTELMGNVRIAPATSESIIQIQVENTNPELANDIARIWGKQLIDWRNERNAGLRNEDRIEAELVDNPSYSLESPRTTINTAAGAVLGALLGVVIILFLEWLESGVVRRSQDVERYLEIPVIGRIPGQ
jgi:capsular polysaccharide biosynthesis protein